MTQIVTQHFHQQITASELEYGEFPHGIVYMFVTNNAEQRGGVGTTLDLRTIAYQKGRDIMIPADYTFVRTDSTIPMFEHKAMIVSEHPHQVFD